MLADAGALVIKIERPGVGDDTRRMGPFVDDGSSEYYRFANLGKESIALNLKDPADLALAKKMIARADIVVENFRPGVMAGLGLDPAKLVELIENWDVHQATTDIMGYMGSRVLADREHVGRYVCIVEFGVVDPAVSAAEEAERNNERPETKAMLAAVTEFIDGPPEYHNFDEIYRTDR